MKEIVKIGIVGFGRMGITHYSIINSHPSVKITAIAEPSKGIVSIAKKYLGDVNIYSNYEDMFREKVVDAIIVCTPPSINYSILKIAASQNIHAFVEKPFCIQSSEAIELSQLFVERRLVNAVGYVNRYNEAFIQTKEFLDSGLLGELKHFKAEMFSATVIKKGKVKGWRSLKKNGGGAVYEIASHAIDLVNYFVGSPDVIHGSSMSKVFSQDVEDIVSSTFTYDSGLTGTLFTNWSDSSYRKPVIQFEFLGTKGKIKADQHGIKIFLNNENSEFALRKGWNTFYNTDLFKNVPFYMRGNDFTSQLYQFVNEVDGTGAGCLCDFKAAAKALVTIESIFDDYESK